MTTDFHISVSNNLYEDDEWPMFSHRSKGNVHQPVSSLSIKVRTEGHHGERQRQWLAQQLEIIFRTITDNGDRHASAFFTHQSMRQDTVINRDRKIWRMPELLPLPAGLITTPELERKCKAGLRYSGYVQVDVEQLTWLADAMTKMTFAIPIFFAAPFSWDDFMLEEMTDAAFPPDGCGKGLLPDGLDWPSFSNFCIRKELVCCRKNLFPEGLDHHFDFFGSLKNINKLYSVVNS